eukprot:4210264-Prymnesium_polylepis.1
MSIGYSLPLCIPRLRHTISVVRVSHKGGIVAPRPPVRYPWCRSCVEFECYFGTCVSACPTVHVRVVLVVWFVCGERTRCSESARLF